MAKRVMARAAVAVVVAAAAASAVHKNVRWKRLWKRFDGFVAIKKKDVRDYKYGCAAWSSLLSSLAVNGTHDSTRRRMIFSKQLQDATT